MIQRLQGIGAPGVSFFLLNKIFCNLINFGSALLSLFREEDVLLLSFLQPVNCATVPPSALSTALQVHLRFKGQEFDFIIQRNTITIINNK